MFDFGGKNPQCIILCGPPYSGKSTFRTNSNWSDTVLSTDDILLRIASEKGISYKEAFETYFNSAQQEYNDLMRSCIKERKSFMVDRTNLTVKSRLTILNQLPKDYYKVAFVFTLPDDRELARRHELRQNQSVPLDVIRSMNKRYELPSISEKFDRVINVVHSR